MDDNMNSIILIGNSTFSYTENKSGKENNNEIICQEAKSNYQNQGAEKQNYLPFNTITITSLGNSVDKSNCQESMQQMEPVVFDNNFGQFGYFTQDYSNLTVYLNDTSLLNNINGESTASNQWSSDFNLQSNIAPDDIGNYPFFRNENAVDFPFINIEPVDKLELNEDLQYLNIINNKIENDTPEYIDINSLVIPSEYQNYFPIENTKKSALVPPFLKRNRRGRTNINDASTSDDTQNDDDDVIFVKEFKHNETPVISEVKVSGCEPRRNPKRQVQMQKVSYDLALKMSLDGYYEDGRFGSRDFMSSSRRSTRTNGAIYSPPNSLSNCDYKEWPVEGMHEKPNFNPVTKKLEKVPSLPKRNKINTTKPAHRPVKKRVTKKKTKKEEDADLTKSFASTTHKTIHSVLSYIEQIKDYNKLTKEKTSIEVSNAQIELSADADRPDVIDNEETLLSETEERKYENLLKAEDILVDSCILYCLANDVKESALAKYFNEISGKENKEEFLNSILDDIETSTK